VSSMYFWTLTPRRCHSSDTDRRKHLWGLISYTMVHLYKHKPPRATTSSMLKQAVLCRRLHLYTFEICRSQIMRVHYVQEAAICTQAIFFVQMVCLFKASSAKELHCMYTRTNYILQQQSCNLHRSHHRASRYSTLSA